MEEITANLIGRLTTRERDVITLRYGLDGLAVPKTLNPGQVWDRRHGRVRESLPVRTRAQVGAILKCTSERIRQIENAAMQQLQFLARLSRLVADARALPPAPVRGRI